MLHLWLICLGGNCYSVTPHSVIISLCLPPLACCPAVFRDDALPAAGNRPAKMEGNIALQGIKFAYPERPDVMVFQNFSLEVDAGKTVALCGQSGSGKSSIVALILRFYDPLSGCLLLDGVDIRQLNLAWLREQMSLVAQEPHLFTGRAAAAAAATAATAVDVAFDLFIGSPAGEIAGWVADIRRGRGVHPWPFCRHHQGQHSLWEGGCH